MAARMLHQLKTKQVDNEKTPGRYADGGGLYLQVQTSANGRGVTKSWLFRYKRAGVAREMGLGPVHTIGLAEARNRAQEARRQLLDGLDPIAARDALKAGIRAAAANAKTFKDCADAYIKAQRPTWSNEKHAEQWENTLATYAHPTIGALPVALIDTAHVVRVLEPIWITKAETASRLRGRIEKILDWAKVMGYRQGENPARWRGHLDHTLAKVSRHSRIKHHEALPFDDAPGFMKELRELDGTAPRALEFLILTAARTGEVIGATWDEIDEAKAVWTVPAERMKAGKEHRVPLTDRALEILAEMREFAGGVGPIFPGRSGDQGLSNMALLKVLKRLGRGDVTTHGFRSTFRDWASERTTFQREVIEMALAHAIADKVEAAYRRGELFEKRTKLMNAWAQFLAKPAAPATVHSIDGKRAKAAA